MKKTPLKPKKNYTLKKTPLKSNNKGLAKTTGLKKTTSLVKTNCKLKKTTSLKRTSCELKQTELQKQSEKAKEKWEEIREIVLKRDNHKCIICGKKATQVHHIQLRSKRKDLIYNINNLVSLCDIHHFHQGSEKYLEQTALIANSKGMSLEELLEFSES